MLQRRVTRDGLRRDCGQLRRPVAELVQPPPPTGCATFRLPSQPGTVFIRLTGGTCVNTFA